MATQKLLCSVFVRTRIKVEAHGFDLFGKGSYCRLHLDQDSRSLSMKNSGKRFNCPNNILAITPSLLHATSSDLLPVEHDIVCDRQSMSQTLYDDRSQKCKLDIGWIEAVEIHEHSFHRLLHTPAHNEPMHKRSDRDTRTQQTTTTLRL